jgi:hypothetical protein
VNPGALLLCPPNGVTAELKNLDPKYFIMKLLEILDGSLSFETSLFLTTNSELHLHSKVNMDHKIQMYVCMYVGIRGGPFRPFHRDPQWSIVQIQILLITFCCYIRVLEITFHIVTYAGFA